MWLQEHNLEEEKKGTYICDDALVLYFHSSLDRNHSDAVLVIELQVVEVSRVVEAVHPVGYCLLSPFSECKQKTEPVLRGSWLAADQQPTGA